RNRRGISERQEIAERVADAVGRALDCTQPEPDAEDTFTHVTKNLVLTPVQVTKEERDWAEGEHKRCVEQGDTDTWWPIRIQQVVDIADGLTQADPVPAEIHILRIGDAVITMNSFELFLDYGHRIKARSPAAQTFVIQLAGPGWYLPTERAKKAGGYGAMPAVCSAGPEGGAELVEATLDAVEELFA
ncbi:MAG: hypothetical protein QF886_25020, partial [Planctomycetota bacterium]|nr:hypothetical protein [Planctomycetota bacterium]